MMSMHQTTRASRGDAEARYRPIRLAALETAGALASSAFATPVALTPIGAEAIDAFRACWADHPRRRLPWPWPEMLASCRRSEPGRFEAAIWSGSTLCGLALGRTRSDYCRVDYAEGSPEPDHPLKGHVIQIVATAAVAYATALGKDEVRLVDPLPELVAYYEMLGFLLAKPKGEAPYCWRKV